MRKKEKSRQSISAVELDDAQVSTIRAPDTAVAAQLRYCLAVNFFKVSKSTNIFSRNKIGSQYPSTCKCIVPHYY